MSEKSLEARILNYLGNGGLINPEMMEHEKVRDLLLDILTELRNKKSEWINIKDEPFPNTSHYRRFKMIIKKSIMLK